jgi:hypothetical protein
MVCSLMLTEKQSYPVTVLRVCRLHHSASSDDATHKGGTVCHVRRRLIFLQQGKRLGIGGDENMLKYRLSSQTSTERISTEWISTEWICMKRI